MESLEDRLVIFCRMQIRDSLEDANSTICKREKSEKLSFSNRTAKIQLQFQII